MNSKNPEIWLSRAAMRFAWFILVFVPLGIALLVERFTDFGHTADPLFFEVMAAGLLPILLVAVIVQYSLVLSQISSSDISPADKEIVRYEHSSTTRLYGAVFAVGEGASLYAVAAATQSTFLLLLTLLEAAVLLVMLLFEVEDLFEPESLLPENFRKETRDRLSARAQQHEEAAAKLRAAADERQKPNDQPLP